MRTDTHSSYSCTAFSITTDHTTSANSKHAYDQPPPSKTQSILDQIHIVDTVREAMESLGVGLPPTATRESSHSCLRATSATTSPTLIVADTHSTSPDRHKTSYPTTPTKSATPGSVRRRTPRTTASPPRKWCRRRTRTGQGTHADPSIDAVTQYRFRRNANLQMATLYPRHTPSS